MPVQAVRLTTTATEFLQWMEYLRMEDERITVDRWYLAQIAAEIRRCFASKNPAAVKIKNFFHKMTRPKGIKTSGKDKWKISRSIWLGAFRQKTKK